MHNVAAWFMALLAVAAIFVIVSHGKGTGDAASGIGRAVADMVEAATGQHVTHEGAAA